MQPYEDRVKERYEQLGEDYSNRSRTFIHGCYSLMKSAERSLPELKDGGINLFADSTFVGVTELSFMWLRNRNAKWNQRILTLGFAPSVLNPAISLLFDELREIGLQTEIGKYGYSYLENEVRLRS